MGKIVLRVTYRLFQFSILVHFGALLIVCLIDWTFHQFQNARPWSSSYCRIISCRRYFASGCCNRDNCIFLHDRSARPDNVCRYYQLGQCFYGDGCRYDGNINVPHILNACWLADILEQAIFFCRLKWRGSSLKFGWIGWIGWTQFETSQKIAPKVATKCRIGSNSTLSRNIQLKVWFPILNSFFIVKCLGGSRNFKPYIRHLWILHFISPALYHTE